jgi:hypothetical protein
MKDLFDILVTDRQRSVRDKWAIEPDFDDIFEWESDDPTDADDDDLSLDEWLEG